MAVRFYDRIDDARIRFSVIIAQENGKWLFCKHKERETLEFPGGHREPGETPGNRPAGAVGGDRGNRLYPPPGLRLWGADAGWGRVLRDAVCCRCVGAGPGNCTAKLKRFF